MEKRKISNTQYFLSKSYVCTTFALLEMLKHWTLVFGVFGLLTQFLNNSLSPLAWKMENKLPWKFCSFRVSCPGGDVSLQLNGRLRDTNQLYIHSWTSFAMIWGLKTWLESIKEIFHRFCISLIPFRMVASSPLFSRCVS